MDWTYKLLPNVDSLLFYFVYACMVENNFRSSPEAKYMELKQLFSAGFRMESQTSWRRV